ncbi:MAG: sulfatase-like hydrolase/transferase, partial [Microbacterium sp.]|nr:sulfatase-like hydrolase/transferase [Microbacterium sp.]
MPTGTAFGSHRPPAAAGRSYAEQNHPHPGGTVTRPNILLIVSDDHGYADRSVYGTTGVRTPVLDRLAAEGVT